MNGPGSVENSNLRIAQVRLDKVKVMGSEMRLERYKICVNAEGKNAVMDSLTGREVVPDCHSDMATYHAYLSSKGITGKAQAQVLLAQVAEGDKPLTTMTMMIKLFTELSRQNGYLSATI